ncbi:MAG: single-stranded-DNA-specific exonuclease RecJ [Fusobacterium gastrosuis]|uniref:single-stranded-DNA-specific exonuclease RecJ n=1 Tax=Fusobacterium gastrosuis TaxID=1755100 RepID=UPI002A8ABF26|nr:single-stranded-DNA-specific exonuclease RecJ [Fusobacterium gastrosuis]
MKKTTWVKNYSNNFYIDKNSKYDSIIESILKDRNLSLDENFNFNPLDFQDMDKAVQRVLKAIEEQEKIYIYGDYDVDGITSVSLLYLAFSELGANVDYYIPLRDDGYGLNKEAIKFLKEDGAKLIISVDCGINSIEEIDLANELNLDFIITDHHEITGILPRALAVINPKRDENKYEFKYLAGVGTAFMLALAIFNKKNNVSALDKYLDIVAIGTVADIVPLISDNRKFVKRGLKTLNNTKWIGLKQLLRKIYPEDYQDRIYSAYDIGYIIAPIFNAAGRLEDAKNAVKLFLEEDAFKCLQMIDELLQNNNERKEIQKKIFEKSVSEVEQKELYNRNLILVANKSFHHGVIGIVASKILDKYYSPTIIMEIKETEGIATASCRSIDGINIVDCLNSVSDILIKYGGHSGAAGFTIAIDNIDEFYDRVDKFIAENFENNIFNKKIQITEILEPYKVSYDFLKQLQVLEPFGSKNHTPVFAFKNCSYSNLRFTRNSTEHIIFDLHKNGYTFKNCIFFNGGDYYDLIVNSKNIDVAFKLKLETFKDRYMYKLQIEDIKNSQENLEFLDEIEKNGKDIKFPIETVAYTRRNDLDSNLSLKFNEYNGIDLIKDRTLVTSLDENLAKFLTDLHKNFSYNFSVKLKEKISKTENINLYLEISKDKDLNSYAIKEAQLFMDIKKHLLGDFNYNSIQKKVLSSFFKNKSKTLVIMEKGRGINTIISTISLYALQKKLKMSINLDLKEADFYIFYNFENLDEIKNLKTDNILVINDKNINLENFIKILDNYEIPQNIKFLSYSDVVNEKKCYHYFLNSYEKKKLIDECNRNIEILATEDIKIHF